MQQEYFCVQLTTTGPMQCTLFQLHFTCQSWLFHSCSHRQNICDFHHDFLVTVESWPAFLYPGGQFDPNNKGLFKGEILVRVSPLYEDQFRHVVYPIDQAFKAIFISPTSTEELENEICEPTLHRKHCQGERWTHANVVGLSGMKTVQPQAIAYVACQACGQSTVTLTLCDQTDEWRQVHFSLSSCGTWAIIDDIFNSHKFYDVIVEWFEGSKTSEDQSAINKLLLWWNRHVPQLLCSTTGTEQQVQDNIQTNIFFSYGT